jgi:hypothetical protein
VSYTDPSADAVQPEVEGQGDSGTGGAPPYQEYLDRIPEELRGQVEPVFRDWDGRTTQRFQEAAEYRRAWEPYEQLGVQQVSPQEVAWLLQFRNAHDNNPQAILDWAREYAQEHGLQYPDGPREAQDGMPYDEFGSGLDQGAFDQALMPVMQRLEAFEQRFAQQDEMADLREAQDLLAGAMQAVPEDVDREMFDSFLAPYASSEFLEQFGLNKRMAAERAVAGALADYNKARATFEKNLLASKGAAGFPPEGGGIANANPEQIKTLKDARAPALELIRQWRSQQQQR